MIYLLEYLFQTKEDLNLRVFNMITGMNESKTLTKHISCKCECTFVGKKCNPNQKWNNDKCLLSVKIWKNIMRANKIIFRILLHVSSCENGKYVRNIIDNSVITFDEIIDATKTVPTKTILTKIILINFYVLHTFLLISIAVSIYFCFMRYRVKRKTLTYQVTNNKLKEVLN